MSYYLQTGDIVTSPNANPEERFVVFNPRPPGSISQISHDEQGVETLSVPGTPAEGVENLVVTGERWPVERTIEAFGHTAMSKSIELQIRERYAMPPYEISE